MRKISLALVPAVMGAVALTAAPAAGGGTATVQVKDDKFVAKTLRIKAGTRVTWKFVGAVEHTVTFGKFHSKGMDSGTYRHTFTKKGTYNYICIYHVKLGMRGKVVVS